jgi:hypothetical protein
MKNLYKILLPITMAIIIFIFENNKDGNSKLQWSEPISISIDTSKIIWKISFYLYPTTKNTLFAWESTVSEIDTNDDIFYREYIDGKLSPIQNISNNPSRSFSPILDVDYNSNVHLLWSERIGKITHLTVATDLFYTIKKNGIFIQPVSIFRRTDTAVSSKGLCGLYIPLNQKMKLDNENNVHILFTTGDTIVFNIFRHLLKKDSTWIESSTIPFTQVYYDFLFDENNIIHLAMIHPAKDIPQYDVNSIFYSSSNDLGKTWTKEVLVNRSGRLAAFDLEILKDNAGIIHIVWGKDSNADGFTDCVYHSISTDGINWSKPDIFGQGLGNFCEDFHIVKDSKNTIYIFFTISEQFIGTSSNLYYSYFNGMEWSKIEMIYSDARHFKAAFDQDDLLHIVYLDRDTNRPTYKMVTYTHTTNPITSITNNKNDIPDHYTILQNYPNPFNSSTVIEYSLPKVSYVEIKVYNINGEIVSNLVNEVQTAGKHQVCFDKNDIASGIYFYQIKAGNFTASKKMILLR